jgi:dCTP deaminase
MLSDVMIEEALNNGALDITPYHTDNLQGASYDVHLGGKLLIPKEFEPQGVIPEKGLIYFDPTRDKPEYREHDMSSNTNRFVLFPGKCVLAHIEEDIELRSPKLAADIAGISSLGRIFLFVHVTAGFVDPRWEGRLTLEIFNASPWAIIITKGMRIAQIRFYYMDKAATRLYSIHGHYWGSSTVEGSKYRESTGATA